MDKVKLSVAERLEDIRKNTNGLNRFGAETLREVEERTGISHSFISKNETGTNENLAKLIQLAQHYGVSMDYICGLSETSSPNIEDQAICKRTGLSEAALKNILFASENDNSGILLPTLNLLLSYPDLPVFLIELKFARDALNAAKQTVDELKSKSDRDLLDTMDGFMEFTKLEDKAEYYLFRASKIITEALKKVVEPEGGRHGNSDSYADKRRQTVLQGCRKQRERRIKVHNPVVCPGGEKQAHN